VPLQLNEAFNIFRGIGKISRGRRQLKIYRDRGGDTSEHVIFSSARWRQSDEEEFDV